MLNSTTNAAHAVALAAYSWFTLQGYLRGKPHYDLWIFLSFFCVLILKIFGIIVHLPAISHQRKPHDFFWTIIAVLIVILNGITLRAVGAPLPGIAGGILLTALLSGFFITSLIKSGGNFRFIALALSLIHLLCAVMTRDRLRLAWLILFGCNVLWILLSRVRFLTRFKFHNDIYHLALIGATFFLYTTIPTGLWQNDAAGL